MGRTVAREAVRLHGLFVLSIAAAAVVASCAKPDGEPSLPPDGATYRFERAYSAADHPVELRIKASRPEFTMAEETEVVVEVEAPSLYEAEIPDRIEVEGLRLTGTEALPLRVAPDRRRIRARRFRLEPLSPGDFIVAPFVVRFSAPAQGAAGSVMRSFETVSSDPLVLTVRSVGIEDAQAAEIKDIRGPVSIRRPFVTWPLLAGTGVLIAALAAYLVWRRYQRRAAAFVIPKRPHEMAVEALDDLLRQRLVEQGRVKEFYLELSFILRRYVEVAFGLHAAEQTTEEFLAAVSHNGFFEPDQRRLLKAFLEHCDLVKFARHLPADDEISESVEAVRRFIEWSRPQEVPDGV